MTDHPSTREAPHASTCRAVLAGNDGSDCDCAPSALPGVREPAESPPDYYPQLEQEATDYAYAIQETEPRASAMIARLASALAHFLELQEAPESDLAAIRARCEASTPGPWFATLSQGLVSSDYDQLAQCYAGTHQRRAANAEFIAHAREDIPRLLAALSTAHATRHCRTGTMTKSLVRENAEANPNYAPYCIACVTTERMKMVERFYWRCRRCGAEHDERAPASALPADTPTETAP